MSHLGRSSAILLPALLSLAGCELATPESNSELRNEAYAQVEGAVPQPIDTTARARVPRPQSIPSSATTTTSEFTFDFRLYQHQRPSSGPGYPAVYLKAASGNFNGDGRDDLVFVMELNEIEVVLQGDDGVFSDPMIYGTSESNTYSTIGLLVVGDFNNDRLDDIVFDTTSEFGTQGGIAILEARPNGAPALRHVYEPAKYSDSRHPVSWAALDVDGDGNLDLVALHNWPEDRVELCRHYDYGVLCHHYLVYYGDGRGGLDEPQAVKIDGLPDRVISDYFAEDVDMDGYIDMVFSLPVTNNAPKPGELYYLRREPAGGMSGPHLVHDVSLSAPLFFGDLNGDGVKDTIAANIIRFRRSDGTFRPPVFLNSYNWESYWNILADFDGNGYTDIVNHQFQFGSLPKFAVYLQTSEDIQLPFFLTDPPTSNFVRPEKWGRQAFTVGDFNNDACRDIAVAIGYSGVLLLNGRNCRVRQIRTGGNLPPQLVRR